jgi:hypothetical protein
MFSSIGFDMYFQHFIIHPWVQMNKNNSCFKKRNELHRENSFSKYHRNKN